MKTANIFFGIVNISTGVLLILISIPLILNKIPMNNLYGFRISKSFISEENWYKINNYGGKQLIFWSFLLIVIGILYFIFPIKNPQNEMLQILLSITPILICAAAVIVKTLIFSKEL
jgi:hypothetical protein